MNNRVDEHSQVAVVERLRYAKSIQFEKQILQRTQILLQTIYNSKKLSLAVSSSEAHYGIKFILPAGACVCVPVLVRFQEQQSTQLSWSIRLSLTIPVFCENESRPETCTPPTSD